MQKIITIPEEKIVLLVEDHEDTRVVLATLLRQQGLTVDDAADGIDALAILLKRKPDVILTDLRMPNMDGLELSRHVKGSSAYKHIPIILISATLPMNSKSHPEIALFIQKPSPVDEIASAIKTILNSKI